MGSSLLATGSFDGSQASGFVKVDLPSVGVVAGEGERHLLTLALVGVHIRALLRAALRNTLVGDGVDTGFESLWDEREEKGIPRIRAGDGKERRLCVILLFGGYH